MRWIETAIITLTVLHLGAAAAQAADYRLQPGARVRLQLVDQASRSAATLVRASDDEVEYQTKSGALNTVPMSTVQSLQVSGGTRGHAGAGALIGGAVGLALGIAAVIAVEDDAMFDPTAGEAVGAMLVTTGVGALAGTMIGALIRTEQWTEVGPTGGTTLRTGPALQVGLAFPLR